ncbi:MAG: hypothetical protein K8F91_15220, partial [Candidatus Obscuribacterales bacterium]|nr:hypothetical protein [Candidatus Obscuribacterales bacterium]
PADTPVASLFDIDDDDDDLPIANKAEPTEPAEPAEPIDTLVASLFDTDDDDDFSPVEQTEPADTLVAGLFEEEEEEEEEEVDSKPPSGLAARLFAAAGVDAEESAEISKTVDLLESEPDPELEEPAIGLAERLLEASTTDDYEPAESSAIDTEFGLDQIAEAELPPIGLAERLLEADTTDDDKPFESSIIDTEYSLDQAAEAKKPTTDLAARLLEASQDDDDESELESESFESSVTDTQAPTSHLAARFLETADDDEKAADLSVSERPATQELNIELSSRLDDLLAEQDSRSIESPDDLISKDPSPVLSEAEELSEDSYSQTTEVPIVADHLNRQGTSTVEQMEPFQNDEEPRDQTVSNIEPEVEDFEVLSKDEAPYDVDEMVANLTLEIVESERSEELSEQSSQFAFLEEIVESELTLADDKIGIQEPELIMEELITEESITQTYEPDIETATDVEQMTDDEELSESETYLQDTPVRMHDLPRDRMPFPETSLEVPQLDSHEFKTTDQKGYLSEASEFSSLEETSDILPVQTEPLQETASTPAPIEPPPPPVYQQAPEPAPAPIEPPPQPVYQQAPEPAPEPIEPPPQPVYQQASEPAPAPIEPPPQPVYQQAPAPVVEQAPSIDESIIALARDIISKAVELGCTDVHFEPSSEGLVLKYLAGGEILADVTFPKEIEPTIVASYKALAGLNPAECRLSQSNTFQTNDYGAYVSMSVSTFPSQTGEHVQISIVPTA